VRPSNPRLNEEGGSEESMEKLLMSRRRRFDRVECENCIYPGEQILLESVPVQHLDEGYKELSVLDMMDSRDEPCSDCRWEEFLESHIKKNEWNTDDC
jgi:hypothetical protein